MIYFVFLVYRTFELSLFPKPELFSPRFQAVIVDENGTETEFVVNKNDFYRGFVKGGLFTFLLKGNMLIMFSCDCLFFLFCTCF